MGIFARLARLIKSNINDLISRSEDPEKMLNQIVIDMSAQLIEAKKQVASSIADEKRLAKQAEQEAANAAEWERRAMMAVRAGDDALAKEALARKKEHEPARAAVPGAVAEAEGLGRSAQAGAARAQLEDRGSEAQEEPAHRAQEAGGSAEGHPGDDERPEERERVRGVRSDGGPHRADGGRGRSRRRAGRGVLGRRARAQVRSSSR